MSLCFECDQPAEFDHHVVPKVRGGKRTVPLCVDCHAKAHHRDKKMATSELTREGLAKAKARGVKLGSARPGHWEGREDRRTIGQRRGGRTSSAKMAQTKRDYYASLLPLMLATRRAGLSFENVADALNAGDWKTSTGKPFTATAVFRILKRS